MPKSPGGALLAGFSVDRSISVPIYRQIEGSLRRSILDGALSPGQKLPSTRELSAELGVSRITVKSVYEQLVAEGYVRSRTGAGTFVADGLDIDAGPGFQLAHMPASAPEIDLSDQAGMITASQANIRHGEIAPFRPGVPALDLFPAKTWNKYLLEAMNADARRNLSYGDMAGSPALRKQIALHLTDARGMKVEPDQVVITSGAQQAFVLLAFVLLRQSQTVWYEDPGHIAGRDVMQILGANVAPVPVDEEGLDLEYALQHHPTPTVIFTTPSHQQPLGTTMSLGRRLALLNHAQDVGAWIIEDDYDSEFRYRSRPLPALSALDSQQRVIYVGTFSKSLFASIRIGYAVVPPALVDPFAKARTLLGQNSSPVVEEALARFMADGRFAEHIRKMRRVYRTRRDALYECLSRDCEDTLDPVPTDAGMHMVAWLKTDVSDRAAHEALLRAGIESLPLSVYCQKPLSHQALVLGFSGVPEGRMPRLVRRMGEVLRSV